ncbi:MAG: right-handed parallel beta-helix repeat-containing protein [Verrucomicrobiota bacterium]
MALTLLPRRYLLPAVLVLLATWLVGARGETYVNQRVTANPDGSYSTNWVECVIDGPVTWKASDGPFIVDQYDLGITVTTNGSLTLEPGSVLEFAASRDWSGIQVYGGLQAEDVLFRRWSRDTNGTWSGIRFYGNSVGRLEHVTVDDGGHVATGWQAPHPAAAIFVQDSSPVIRGATVRRSGMHGLRLVQSSSATVEGNRFEDCAGHAVLWTDLGGAPVFKGNSGTNNHFSGIFIGNGTLRRDWRMTVNSIPYILQGWDANLVVAPEATLSIDPGTVVKGSYGRDGGAIDIYGTLQCGGAAASVVLTSMEDDSILGDTDQTTNSTYRGAWSGLRFQAGSRGTIVNTELRYAGHVTSGWQAGHPGAAIWIDNAAPSIRQCQISDAEGFGLKFTGTASPVVEDNEIRRCGDYAIFWSAFAGSPILANNHGSDNGHDGVFLPNGTLTSDTVFHLNPGLPFVTAGWDGVLAVETNVTLTLLPGVVVKNAYGRDGGAIVVSGRLSVTGEAGRPVILTSLEDDVQGDTDRTTNAVYAGAWSGVRVYAPGRASFSHAEIRYAGHVSVGWQGWHPGAAVYAAGATVSMQDVVVAHAQDLAVRCKANDLAIQRGVFSGGPRGLWFEDSGGTNCFVNGSQFLDMADYAVINSNPTVELDARGNWWGHITGPGGVGSGQGAKVSEHVRFEPYSSGFAARLYVGIAGGLQPPAGLSGPFRILSGVVPAGLQFDPATGALAGTPSATGSALIEVQSGDAPSFYYVVENGALLHSPPDQSDAWSTRPTFSWDAADGAVYRFQLASDPAFTQVLLDLPNLTVPSRSIGPLQASTGYYWRVNSSALGGGWSPVAALRTWPSGPLSAYAVQFDGVDDRMVLRVAPELARWPQWSITAWVKPATVQTTAYPTIFSYGYWGATLGLNRGSGALESWVNNSSQLVGSQALPIDQWSFVALVNDGKHRWLYLNGEEVARDEVVWVAPAAGAAIGGEPGGKASSHFAGAIDELGVWQRALDNDTLRRCMSRRLSARETSLALGFAFDEGAGVVMHACSSGAPSADLMNGPVWVLSDAGHDWPDSPELTVDLRNDHRLGLSWGLNGGDCALEQSSTLGPNANWQTVPSAPSSTGLGYTLVISGSSEPCF